MHGETCSETGYLPHTSSELAKVGPRSVQLCIGGQGRLLGGGGSRAGCGRTMRGSLGRYRGTKERTFQTERSHVHVRAWQAGEPLRFTPAGGGAGVQGRGTWEMKLDAKPSLVHEGPYVPGHGA